ncbi:acyl-CoA dehydrogenase family protein [Aeromicrobium duanguangcaii]|uniref:Acyl-CoA dehydrogenase family protein n=1 Tax=Aeromicrobium duanguangcaii TaxID=2968086 RepID=A0ABY5KIE2_9ACTN|nr:acyl-CoA dehydrogenase family protein [Aeromicrobium duanguangcaii]MCD9153151.1 acyl-CoA dehydrogenase family protein [Aeromicrobium duanguangcaii]UUI69748.1 acyl-CoA dehydrogenase family protein [Aeromicrobium duanguangcaii]
MDPVQRIPENQAVPFDDVNIATADLPLMDAVRALGEDQAGQIRSYLEPIGALAGTAEAREHWHLANAYPPVHEPVDRFGRRIDEIRFHPSWHWLMERGVGFGLTAEPWTSDRPAAHLRRAAGFYTWGQVEQGHMCPITMTYAVVPALRADPELAAQWTPGLASTTYDFGLRAPQDKAGLLAGMGMTEKQGGSDLRVNSTIAKATDVRGEYRLTGHKWFTSAAMNDVFLVLAQTDAGSTCFVVPRVLPDGTRNPLTIVRLKDKLGNKSNASSELEFDDTWAVRLGEEGRGIRTILEMVSATRMDCILGSASIMRKAFAEAAWHTRHRSAFGARLIDQPAMVGVLADLALESEAGMLAGLRLAAAMDRPDDEHERNLRRIGLALEKYWVCKRTPMMVGEALECLGGNGYAEESGMPLLFRESPLNSIWEGSGNVNALDVLRALSREDGTLDAWRTEVGTVRGEDARLDAAVAEVMQRLADPHDAAASARWLASRMAAILQGALMIRYSTPAAADAFCASRLGGQWAGTFGTLPAGLDLQAILERAQPAV